MVVQQIHRDDEFNLALSNAGSKLVVIDFYADWCGPCRMAAPMYEQLSNKYPDAVFLKVNVEMCRMVSSNFLIRAMPTFVLVLSGKEVTRIQGANIPGLENLIVQHLPTAKPNPNRATPEEKAWTEPLLGCVDKVAQYEDEVNQTLALSVIPAEKLREKARISGKENQYELAKALLAWFHDEFFEWVDTPKCEKCQKKTDSDTYSSGIPTPDELSDGANRVEVYRCKDCSAYVRFPRFNNPARLLETRKGRCGEWANCFTLCCRAMGLEARFVMDDSDHVWTEIWSDDLDRWVHCDPCENVMDTPLMYEKGWNKKFAYVFAFAKDHIRDVTWRYTFKYKVVIGRRTKCRESVLRNFLNKLNVRLQKNLPKEEQDLLNQRFLRELIEFTNPKLQLRDGSEAENFGRKSGDQSWRVARGELGPSQGLQKLKITQSLKLNEHEIQSKKFRLEYDIVSDAYKRVGGNPDEIIKGWASLAFEAKDIFRKVETDWKKAYLCRKIGTASGEIAWKVDLSGLSIKRIEINLGKLEIFQSGNILSTVCCGDTCLRVPENGKITIDDTAHADYLLIQVQFSGGSGDIAWQQAQLFRTSTEEPTKNLIIEIELE